MTTRTPKTSAKPRETTASKPPTRFDESFSASDAVMWKIERDPTLRTTIVAVAVFDRAPDWDALRQRILDVADDVPRLRQRVVETYVGEGTPRWEDDPSFDLDYHLRHVSLPAPGDFAALLELAAPIAMAPFDRSRPLWEFTLVEGLDGGRAALIEKIHHTFTDGVGGMLLAQWFVDPDRDGRTRKRRRRTPSRSAASRAPDRPGRLLRQVLEPPMTAFRLAAVGLPKLALAALRDPAGFTSRAARGTRSAARLLAPATAPLSPIMQQRGASRRLAGFDVSLPDAMAAAHVVEGTLNDAFLAAIAGGMRQYHELNRSTVEGLRVTMPINRRREGDPMGNRFTPVRFTIPVRDESPESRMRSLGDLARRWRREPAVPATEVIAEALNRLPGAATTALFGSMLKGVDILATNVPGLTAPVYFAGAEVLRHYAFAPLSGAAVSIALMTHGDVACIGINGDTAAVPDVDVLRDCIADAFDEVLDVGRQ